jgi:hypothetical protein
MKDKPASPLALDDDLAVHAAQLDLANDARSRSDLLEGGCWRPRIATRHAGHVLIGVIAPLHPLPGVALPRSTMIVPLKFGNLASF